MKKISQINEGMWGSALKRSNTCELRKEDISKIHSMMDALSLTESEYTINDDNTIDVFKNNFVITRHCFIDGEIPYKFRKIYGNCFINLFSLKSLKNIPDIVDGVLKCYYKNKIPFSLSEIKNVCKAKYYITIDIYDGTVPF